MMLPSDLPLSDIEARIRAGMTEDATTLFKITPRSEYPAHDILTDTGYGNRHERRKAAALARRKK